MTLPNVQKQPDPGTPGNGIRASSNGAHPALADIAKGYAVVPWTWATDRNGKRIKRPTLAAWQREPITSPDRWGHIGNHGIVLRPSDRLLVVDIDRKGGKDGVPAFREWLEDTGLDSKPYAVQRTPSGGLHFVGRIPTDFPADSLPTRQTGRDGVDLLRVASWFGRTGGYESVRDLPALEDLPEWPVSFLTYVAGKTGGASSAAPPSQEELQAPSFERLVDVVNRLPNGGPDFESRESYVQVGYAIKAAAGSEYEGEAYDLFHAWAGRWEDGENAADTIRRDWQSMRGPFRVGFRFLAEKAGVQALEAADEFEAVDVPLPAGFSRAGDLLAKEFSDQRWVVDGLIPVHGGSMLVSKPKVGKSTLARALAVAVVQGRPILGRDVMQGPVVYLQFLGEGGEDDAQDSFRALGLKDTDPLVHYFGAWTPDLPKQLDEVLHRTRPVLVVVDTLQKFLRVRDLNDYAQVNTALEPYQTLFDSHGCHALYLHHARKGTGGDDIDMGLGSAALSGSVETAINLWRSESDQRLIKTVQRNAKDAITEAREIVLDQDTGWLSLGLTAKEAAVREMEGAVIGFLRDAAEPVTMGDLTGGITGDDKLIRSTVRRLRGRDWIRQTGAGRKGDPKRFELLSGADEFDVPDEA